MQLSQKTLRTSAAVGIAALGFALPTFAFASKGADDPVGSTGTTGTHSTTATTGTTTTGTTTGTTGTTTGDDRTTAGEDTTTATGASTATTTARARAIAAARARVPRGAQFVRAERSASGVWKVRFRRAGVRYDVRVSRTFTVLSVKRST